jgi:hypothetical protein
LSGGALALLFLPVGGVDPTPVPVQGPRSVEAFISAGMEVQPRKLALAASAEPGSTRVLMLDADRDGDVVLFDHDDHAERLGGERSCETCHHLTKPLDENTACSECHRDMYEPRSVFDHDVHTEYLGGNQGCVECHSDGGEVKSYETITECSECHEHEIAKRSFVEAPEGRWGGAVGYMYAMHGLCVECHEREALKGPSVAYPENLNRCMTCHDVDWREDVRRLSPQRKNSGQVVAGPMRAPSGTRGGGE